MPIDVARIAKALALVVSFFLVRTGGAGADFDHDRARRAYGAGEIVSLASILAAVERDHPGQVVEVELERDDGRWLYEVEILTPDGRVVEFYYDAATGEARDDAP